MKCFPKPKIYSKEGNFLKCFPKSNVYSWIFFQTKDIFKRREYLNTFYNIFPNGALKSRHGTLKSGNQFYNTFQPKIYWRRGTSRNVFSSPKIHIFTRGELLEMFFPNQRWIQKRGTSWNVFPYQRPKINSEDRTLVAQFVNDCGLIEMSNSWYLNTNHAL